MAGQHYIIQDELLQLLHQTVSKNSHSNIQSTIKQALPKKLHVSFFPYNFYQNRKTS